MPSGAEVACWGSFCRRRESKREDHSHLPRPPNLAHSPPQHALYRCCSGPRGRFGCLGLCRFHHWRAVLRTLQEYTAVSNIWQTSHPFSPLSPPNIPIRFQLPSTPDLFTFMPEETLYWICSMHCAADLASQGAWKLTRRDCSFS